MHESIVSASRDASGRVDHGTLHASGDDPGALA